MVYFISDVHLGFFDCKTEYQRETLLVDFLNAIENDCKILILVGDLFDFWFDYRYVIPKHFYRTLAKIYDLVCKNIEIVYLMGNHDFGHYRFFDEEYGIKVLENDLELDIYGKKFYITHGDGKIKNDFGYGILKKILRNRISQKLFRLIHPDLGIWLAAKSSKRSRNFSQKNTNLDNSSLFEFAKQKIEQGFDIVVAGHSHRLEFQKYKDGIYINLGDWLNEPHFAKFNGESIALYSVRELIRNNRGG
ncbi:MAG: UDP-2,3-diacylglucosamine diphosphatase [Ignavibacteria bacterium]|nr:UDP-2,3-diacylglucosamine diphosphatase [Ignavibacteria bacterium]